MFWLRHPPYLRWVLAALVIVAGLAWELGPTNTIEYPFAAEDIAAGQALTQRSVLRSVPAGMLPAWNMEISGFAVADIPAGTPLLPSLASVVHIPANWWAVPTPLPQLVAPGTHIRIALPDGTAEGIVAAEPIDNGFEYVAPVAFPADEAARVAQVAATDSLVVMVATSSNSSSG